MEVKVIEVNSAYPIAWIEKAGAVAINSNDNILTFVINTNSITLTGRGAGGTLANQYAGRVIGEKSYELKDHLGNVRVVISDEENADGTAQILSYANYLPFGMEMPGGSWSASNSKYRYGFNGKEKDTDFSNNYDYGFRIYNANIAKFLSVDPLTDKYPFYTPYQFAGNKPIQFIDLDGLEESENWFQKMARSFAELWGQNGWTNQQEGNNEEVAQKQQVYEQNRQSFQRGAETAEKLYDLQQKGIGLLPFGSALTNIMDYSVKRKTGSQAAIDGSLGVAIDFAAPSVFKYGVKLGARLFKPLLIAPKVGPLVSILGEDASNTLAGWTTNTATRPAAVAAGHNVEGAAWNQIFTLNSKPRKYNFNCIA